MELPLRCRCGTVRGRVELDRAWARITCCCTDCQSFARFLGTPGILDAAGGTDIVPMAPDAVRFTAGSERVACMSLGPNGLLRWYADCCRTPLANLPREPKMYYCGLIAECLEDSPPGTLEARFWPRGSAVVQAGSALAPVRSSRWRVFRSVLGIAPNVIGAWLRRRRIGEPFFDGEGRPTREPETITREQREALRDPLA